MKPRLFACIAVSMAVIVASALSSRIALAQDKQEGQEQKSDSEREKWGIIRPT